MEPATIRHLADAAAALMKAAGETTEGFVEDHCGNALREVSSAIAIACHVEGARGAPVAGAGLSAEAAALRDANGDTWGEHPDHPVSDWTAEVDRNDTRLGYWEWVAARIEEQGPREEIVTAPEAAVA